MSEAGNCRGSPRQAFAVCGACLAATIVHFWLCVTLGYIYGRALDIEVPDWIRSLDRVLLYSLSTGAEFAVLLVWWCVVGLVAWPLYFAIGKLATLLLGEPGTDVAKAAAALMMPTFAFSLLSLMLFPVVAARHTESPTALDIATVTTSQGFGYYTILGLHCLLGLAIMFVVLLSVVGWFEAKWRAAGWGFVVGLPLGLAACGAFCAGLNPAMDRMFDRVGLLGSAAVYLTLVTVVTVVPRAWQQRADRRR